MISGVVRQLLAPALAVCLIAVLLWPAFYNGGPFLDSDTPAYARYADTAVAKLTKHQSTWAQSHAAAQVESLHGADSGSSADHKAPFAGRSIYYGALLALGNAFGMWPSIFLQAAMLLATVALTLVETIGLTARSISIATIALALTTPVAFFASRLMPDAFAGVAILALANLFVYGARMTGWRLLAWTGLLAASLLMHSSHVLIALTLTALGAIGRQTLRWPLSWRGMSCAFIALAIALMGEAAFVLVTKAAFGVSPIRPPFLTARLIADGPGEAYSGRPAPHRGSSCAAISIGCRSPRRMRFCGHQIQPKAASFRRQISRTAGRCRPNKRGSRLRCCVSIRSVRRLRWRATQQTRPS